MTERLLPRVGDFRRHFLMMACAAYLLLGISYIVSTPTAGRKAGFAWLPGALSISTLGWVWVAVAVLVSAASIIWPHSRKAERLCFAGLTVPPTLWAGIFAASWLLGEHPLGYASMISYGLMTGMSLLAASWPNPPEIGGGVHE